MHYRPGNMTGRQAQHASLKVQFGFMGKPIRRVNQDKMSISSIFSG